MPSVPGIGDQQIDMDVIVMVAVATRSEHGIEFSAGPGEHGLQERLLARRAIPPPPVHADLLAAGEAEPGDVERIAERVLRNVSVPIAVAAAAAIRRYLFDLDHGTPEIVVGGWLHRCLHPAIERRGQRATDRGRWLESYPAAQQP